MLNLLNRSSMKHSKSTRTAAVAATLFAAGLVAAGPASAAESQGSATTRITTVEQLHASILSAAGAESSIVCGAALGIHPMGGYPPPPIGPA
jgi:hypothetical protein